MSPQGGSRPVLPRKHFRFSPFILSAKLRHRAVTRQFSPPQRVGRVRKWISCHCEADNCCPRAAAAPLSPNGTVRCKAISFADVGPPLRAFGIYAPAATQGRTLYFKVFQLDGRPRRQCPRDFPVTLGQRTRFQSVGIRLRVLRSQRRFDPGLGPTQIRHVLQDGRQVRNLSRIQFYFRPYGKHRFVRPDSHERVYYQRFPLPLALSVWHEVPSMTCGGYWQMKLWIFRANPSTIGTTRSAGSPAACAAMWPRCPAGCAMARAATPARPR